MARVAADRLERVARVFRRAGYHGASLSRLSEASGFGRASLYHHFPDGKLAMAHAVVEHANQVFASAVLETACAGVNPAQRLRRIAQALDRYYDGGKEPCLLGVLALGDIDAGLRAAVGQGFDNWIDALKSILIDARLSPVVARQRAEDAVAGVQGALLMSRVLGHNRPLKRVLASLASLATP